MLGGIGGRRRRGRQRMRWLDGIADSMDVSLRKARNVKITHPSVKNWDHPQYPPQWARTSACRVLGRPQGDNPRAQIINNRLPGAQRGLEAVCSFSPPVLLETGKTNADVFCSSRGFPENLRRSDKQIFARLHRMRPLPATASPGKSHVPS